MQGLKLHKRHNLLLLLSRLACLSHIINESLHILHITNSKETKIYERKNPQSDPCLFWSFYTFQMTLNVNNVKERPQKQHHGRHWTNCPCITLLQRCRWALVEESQFLDIAGNCWNINIECHQFKEMLFNKRNICPTPGGQMTPLAHQVIPATPWPVVGCQLLAVSCQWLVVRFVEKHNESL